MNRFFSPSRDSLWVFFFVLATCWTPAFNTNNNYKETRLLSYYLYAVLCYFLLNFDTQSSKYTRMHGQQAAAAQTARDIYVYSKWSTLANLESILNTPHHHTSSIFIFYCFFSRTEATSISRLIQLNGVLQLIQLDFFSQRNAVYFVRHYCF